MIPDFQTVMRPVLALLADGEVRRARDIRSAMADHFDLTPEERDQFLPSGRQRVMDNRVGWALTHLAQAGLLRRPQRGSSQITDAGRQVLATHPERIDMKVLAQFPAFVEFRERTRDPVTRSTSIALSDPEQTSTPQELVEQVIGVNRAELQQSVLQRALELTPTGFEDLVLHLLTAMGYGSTGSIERTSSTGDAGVDGIISQDPLGLDRIYVQAKRYAVDRSVDRPRIHEFAGALLGKQGDRGVFITTASFTSGAKIEAERINARIELIDGARLQLAALLVQHGVGVQEAQKYTLYRLDEDFFDAL